MKTKISKYHCCSLSVFRTSIHNTLWHPIYVLIFNFVSTAHFLCHSFLCLLTFISLLLFFFFTAWPCLFSVPGYLHYSACWSMWKRMSFCGNIQSAQCATTSIAHPCVSIYSCFAEIYFIKNIKSLYYSFHFPQIPHSLCLFGNHYNAKILLSCRFVSFYSFFLLFLSELLCLLCWLN